MPRSDTSQIPAGDALLAAVRNRAASIREKFKDDPVGLATRFGLKLPEKPVNVMLRLGKITPSEALERFGPTYPGLRDLVENVCTGQVDSAVAVANRGGGKSQGVSFIEFFLVFIKDFDALNLGGSELQAQGVYNYILSYIDHDPEFQQMVKGESTISQTHTTKNAWIRVMAASQKSVRSPHAGGRKRDGRIAGGILVIDEEAETEKNIVSAAMYTINTAIPAVNVRASTFHNAEGSFAEVMDNAEEMGYEIYKWDIFDVAEKCDCTDGCQSEESCFREDHYEDYIDPTTGEETKRLLHRAYCGGRAMYADGWIPVREIVKLWRRGKRNHSVWEVEAMGSRPSSKGFVIRDLTQFARNKTERSGNDLYLPGWPVTICVDWGARNAGVEVWQEQPGDRHALLEAEQVEEAGLSQIIGQIIGLRNKYANEFKEVAADIGGGGNYLNPKLRDEHLIPVRDVNFAEAKEAAAAALNVFSESSSLLLPEEHTDFHKQMRNWKRKDGRIQKGNDHLCDTALCYFAQFIDRLGLTNIRVPPRSITSASGSRDHPGSLVARPGAVAGPVASGRIAVVRTLGRPRR